MLSRVKAPRDSEQAAPEKAGTFLEPLFWLSHQPIGPAVHSISKGETEEYCTQINAWPESLERNHFKAHICIFIHPHSLCFPTSDCGQGKVRPVEAISNFQAQKSAQVTTLSPLLLGSTVMSVPCCLATSISHDIHTQSSQWHKCLELLSYSFQRKGLKFKDLRILNGSPATFHRYPGIHKIPLEQDGPIQSKCVPLVTHEFVPDGCTDLILIAVTCQRDGKGA